MLYNLNKAKKYSEEKPIIIVEGFKSVWRFLSYDIPNVVACMGNKITPGQQNLLISYALKGIVVMFDCDVAGAEGISSAYKDLKDKIEVTPIFITQDGLDPADLSCEQIHQYLEGYM